MESNMESGKGLVTSAEITAPAATAAAQAQNVNVK